MTDILITGGCGFLGVSVARLILARRPGARVTLSDIAEHPRAATFLKQAEGRVTFTRADLTDPAACRDLVSPTFSEVYHFASLVSGGAEKDFEAGLRANVFATIYLAEAIRHAGGKPKIVFTSSIATFGGAALPQDVNDLTHQHPQNSYGVAKVLGEQLLNDYSRKGYLDARSVRLPAIVVRDEPNTAVSGYASSIIREPLAGRDYVCPVRPDTRIPILSVRKCAALLADLGQLPWGALADFRAINGPSLSPTAQDLAAAVGRAAGRVPRLGRITFSPDDAIQKIVSAWPRHMHADRAAALGLTADASVDALISDYLDDLASGGLIQ